MTVPCPPQHAPGYHPLFGAKRFLRSVFSGMRPHRFSAETLTVSLSRLRQSGGDREDGGTVNGT